jgi:Zn-finger nucleic acid-binding protein
MGGETVDRCPRCRGLWFDAGELESMVGLVRLYTDVRLDEDDIDTIPEVERSRNLACPDDGERLDEKDIGQGFVIDVCPSCQGIWLDDGELLAIRLIEDHVEANVRLYERLGR